MTFIFRFGISIMAGHVIIIHADISAQATAVPVAAQTKTPAGCAGEVLPTG